MGQLSATLNPLGWTIPILPEMDDLTVGECGHCKRDSKLITTLNHYIILQVDLSWELVLKRRLTSTVSFSTFACPLNWF